MGKKETKNNFIGLRITDQQKNKILENCKNKGLTISQYIIEQLNTLDRLMIE